MWLRIQMIIELFNRVQGSKGKRLVANAAVALSLCFVSADYVLEMNSELPMRFPVWWSLGALRHSAALTKLQTTDFAIGRLFLAPNEQPTGKSLAC
ncbi:hypothetical protein P171DRAFT_432584 [Karstenula rhodostoma CBS 690.94]|uniref:Uncharacterized protein n=1 Tax=Karstenula rhodostoma CBS 690.94 TaxID=1392251 RepID=A0A9P4UAI9_9PLEO|nr:hypothetical protein P171DRAFT_432584 [Karstenula rhodostoma CBS 690.94]